MATRNSSEVIDLTKDDDMEAEQMEKLRNNHPPRIPPLSRTHNPVQLFATIYREGDAVSASTSFSSPTSMRGPSSADSQQPARPVQTSPMATALDFGLFFGRQASVNPPVNGVVSNSQQASSAAQSNSASPPARPGSQQASDQRARLDLRPEPLYGRSSPNFHRPPSGQASSPRSFAQPPQSAQPSASSPSGSRPAAPGSSDYMRAPTTQAQPARSTSGNTPTTTAGQSNQASPNLSSQSWMGRQSPVFGNQQASTASASARASPHQSFTARASFGHSTPPYQRQTSSSQSFMETQQHQHRLQQQRQQLEDQRQYDQHRQRILDQQRRQDQQRQLEMEEQRRQQAMQRKIEEEQKRQKESDQRQQDEQRQQRQEEQQRLQRQHLAQAHAQAQAHQAQTQQQHQHQQNQHQQNQQRNGLHHSASTGHLSSYSLNAGTRSPAQHSPQHSPHMHPSSTSAPLWSSTSTPLATAGGPPSSLQPSQTHPLPNPTAYRSASAGGHTWQTNLQQFHTPHRRNSPLIRNSPPSQTLPPVQTKSPPHPYGSTQVRQHLPNGRPSPGQESSSTMAARNTSGTQQQQQQTQTGSHQPLSAFSLRKSPPRDIQTQQAQSHPGRSPPDPSPPSKQGPSPGQPSTTAQTSQTHAPARPVEPLWSGRSMVANRPAPTGEALSSRQQPVALSSSTAGAGARTTWAPSPTLVASSSPVSISSGSSSPRPGSAAATTSTNPNSGDRNINNLNLLRPRFSAQIELLPDRLRLGTGGPYSSQPISNSASSGNSPMPLSPSSVSSFPDSGARRQDKTAPHGNSTRDKHAQSNLHSNVALHDETLPDAPATTLQDVTRQDAALQDKLLQAEARRATENLALTPQAREAEIRRAEAQQVEVLQAAALRADALQAEALLAEARRAEAMQAAEAQRVDAMKIDAIQAEVLRTGVASPNRTLSANTTPTKNGVSVTGSDVHPIPSPAHTPKAQQDWTVAKIMTSLETYLDALLVDHGRDVEYAIDVSKPQSQTVFSSFDDFADLPVQNIDASDATTDRVLLRGKLHRDNQKRPETRTIHARVLPLKTPGEAVPKYRFHHVEIAKNILSPNTPLKFIPHLRDFEDNSEEKRRHDQWIEELESMERKSGFDSSKLFQKGDTTRKSEFTKLLSDYLDHWIARLGIDNCSKTSLIRYMANESQNDQTITPQQKNSLLSSCGEDSATPRAAVVASMLTEAFNRVFASRDVTLYDVLKQDEAVENVFDPKKATKNKDQDKEPSLEQIQQYLGTYTSLKCMICNTHSCEHGEFDAENVRRCFSIDDLGGKLWKHVERRRDRQVRELGQLRAHQQKALGATSGNSNMGGSSNSGEFGGSSKFGASSITPSANSPPCRNKCYRSYDVGDAAFTTREWTENETNLLRSFHLTFANSTGKVPCALCPMMGRHCWEIYRRMKELGLPIALRPDTPSQAADPPTVTVKPVTWYDRHRKVLNGDWSDHTHTHMYALREQREPCNHDGPCTSARGCPCVEAKLLCERFCRCTAECCAFKFTGCACHGSGKTCYQRQKEGKPCICVQLNRECDPVLCGGCGARERADPENRDNDELHATGCQNVSLQRGKSKAVVLGQSQLQGCGYGLFTAEDIGADEFIIEYIGELITHDEGVRREARRGDFFDQGANASYLFTLLEQDGIWVDAAIYGNLSRYINHASESDKRGCNITPKILYVNGEFRIRFAAMRDIKAGEELFFNYGENFPNLTKKLLEDKASASDDEAAASTAKRSRGGAAQRSAGSNSNSNSNNRRKTSQQTMRSRAPTKSVQSGPSNSRNGSNANANASSSSKNNRGANSSSLPRRPRPKGGARKEAPPPHRADTDDLSADDDDGDVDNDDDDDVDHMDIDGGSGAPQRSSARSRSATKSTSLKRKRRPIIDDDDGDDESDGGLKDKIESDDEKPADRSRRAARSSRRRTTANAATTAPSTAAPAAPVTPSVTETADLPETPRRLRARLNAQQVSDAPQQANGLDSSSNDRGHSHDAHDAHDADEDDDVPIAMVKSDIRDSPRASKRRAATCLSNNAAATYADGDNDTDQQPLRKRPRIGSRRGDAAASASAADHHTDSDNMVVDSDDSIPTRSLRQRRSRQRQRVTELSAADLSDQHAGSDGGDGDSAAASAVVALGTTDDDQGSVFSSHQFCGRSQNSANGAVDGTTTTTSTTAPTKTTSSMTTRRRNIVPDSDDDLDASQNSTRASRSGGRNSSRPSSSSQPIPAAAATSRVGTPLSQPHTPKVGDKHSSIHDKVDATAGGGGSISRSSSSRRNLRRGDDSAAAARPGSSGSASVNPNSQAQQQQQQQHTTPVNSRVRSGGEDDSGGSSVDRSQRKRQMPARYRTEDAA
ncbi:hypothetical protein Sste5346_000112 [Sporothrix stenoceras]|uniref:Set domain containing protein n=1 Tax=Sporothrix stenoceras TaxID=5173 RepID=A0ABR3ZSS2_9PEZI